MSNQSGQSSSNYAEKLELLKQGKILGTKGSGETAFHLPIDPIYQKLQEYVDSMPPVSKDIFDNCEPMITSGKGR